MQKLYVVNVKLEIQHLIFTHFRKYRMFRSVDQNCQFSTSFLSYQSLTQINTGKLSKTMITFAINMINLAQSLIFQNKPKNIKTKHNDVK